MKRFPCSENFLFYLLGLLIFSSCQSPRFQPNIDQEKGVDPGVNYDSLTFYGPWDDRNYQLTKEDLSFLSPEETQILDPIPAFYRVELRKNDTTLSKTGPAQYPRSALQFYLKKYEGYEYNGNIYDRIQYENGQYYYYRNTFLLSLFSSPPATFINERRVSSPIAANESAVKVHPLDPNIIVAGTNGPGGIVQRMHFSQDGGQSWTMTDLPSYTSTCCDPSVDWSSDGTYAYASTLAGVTGGIREVWFFRSSNNGLSWDDLPGIGRIKLPDSDYGDKDYIHVDKYSGSPYTDNIYVGWHAGNRMYLSRSEDFGETWTTFNLRSEPRGVGHDIVTDLDGDVYFFYPAFRRDSYPQAKILLKKGTNAGGPFFNSPLVEVANTNASFAFPLPAMETRAALVYISADVDFSVGPNRGSIYAAWTDTYSVSDDASATANHSRIQIAYSRDQGSTWTVVTPHTTVDRDFVDRFNQWLAVGKDGTLHCIYYNTRNSIDRTGVDLYYTYSTDGGLSFSDERRMTTETSPNILSPQEFGDYNGLDHVVRQIASYTDNRLEGGGVGDSEDVYSVTNPFALEWTEISTPTSSDLYTGHFPSPAVGYMAGLNGTVIKTTDGGNNWEIKNNGIPSSKAIYSIFFSDDNRGIAVGNFGTAYQTNDGGDNWTPFTVSSANLRNVFFLTDDIGFIVADGDLYQTINRTTWTNITSRLPAGTILQSSEIYFTDVNTGFILLQGAVLKTIDGGMTWRKIDIPALATYDIQFVNSNLGYLCGIGTGLLVSKNGGDSWDEVVNFPDSRATSLAFKDSDTGVVVSADGEIFITLDGGISWIIDNTTASESIHDVNYLSAEGTFILNGNGGMVLKR